MNETIQQRAERAQANACDEHHVSHDCELGRLVFKHVHAALTSQQSEAEQARRAELERLTKERDHGIERMTAAQAAFTRIREMVGATERDPMPCESYVQRMVTEREALARQVEDLSKRVNDLREALVKIRDASPSVAISEATAKVALGFDEFAMKGETHE